MRKLPISLSTLRFPETKSIRIPKRQKFLSSALALTVSIFLVLFVLKVTLPLTALLLISLTVFLTFWTLDFDLRPIEYLIFAAYPLILTAVALFYSKMFLPKTAGGLFYLLFGIFVMLGYYLLFATLNVLNVATVRALPLKKAALTTFSSFALILTFVSVYGLAAFHPSHFLFGSLLALLAIITVLPLFYVTEIEFSSATLGAEIVGKPFLRLGEGLVLSLIFAETAVLASFWKVSAVFLSLLLTTLLSSLLGIWQHHLQKNLNSRIIREYFFIFLAILLVFIVAGSGR